MKPDAPHGKVHYMPTVAVSEPLKENDNDNPAKIH